MNDEEVGDSMRRFQHLRVLSFLHVGKLPNSIGSLKQLWYMNLSESSEHRLSETMCTLHNLRILILRGCKNLVELPTNLLNLTNLYHLDIKGTRLQQVTPQMVDLGLSECHCSFLPPLGQLAYLKTILIKAFDKVESVGCEFYGNCISTSIAFKSLESLTFERMPQWFEWIPNVAESEEKVFSRLQVLCISEGPKLKKSLPGHLHSLKELAVTKCS
ncbi:hypothetical protein Peur_027169 [Populus x canadensis]